MRPKYSTFTWAHCIFGLLWYGWPFVSKLRQGIRGFSSAYTCLHTLRMGLKFIYTTIWIAYISAGICEKNSQIFASYKDPYIRMLKCAYVRVSQITLYMPARKCLLTAWLFVYDSSEKYFDYKSSIWRRQWSNVLSLFIYRLNVCHCSPTTEFLETVMRLLNDCARFYPQADLYMAENLIVRGGLCP